METENLLRGRLMKVNGETRTAELHSSGDSRIALKFHADLSETMQQLATCFVEVKVAGRGDDNDRQTPLAVCEVGVGWPTVDEFYALEPKIFDPEKARTTALPADDPLDIEEFIRVIYEARDA